MAKLHKVGQLKVACETYIIHDGKVLMHKRAAEKKVFPNFWIGPGGHIEGDEDALAAAIREVKEETGVTLAPKQIQLKVLAFHHRPNRGEIWVEYLFRAEIPESQPIHSTPEGDNQWVDLDKALQLEPLFPPTKYYLEHILNPHTGILYNASSWDDEQLLEVFSEHTA